MLAVLATATLLAGAPALADVPAPVIPKATTGVCVDDPASMRRNHADLLSHQRDGTMRLGDRGGKNGLKGCVGCHAVAGEDGKAVSIASPQHFCRACHSYVGVKPDCFQCHSSVPEAKGQASAADQGGVR